MTKIRKALAVLVLSAFGLGLLLLIAMKTDLPFALTVIGASVCVATLVVWAVYQLAERNGNS